MRQREAKLPLVPCGQARRYIPALCVVALIVATAFLRLWKLDHIPPWLWWDEAGNGLDARDVLHGTFRIFFPRSLGKEPLYIYLTVPFVALWDGKPFAVRLAAMMMGILMVPALYIAGRALWRDHPRAGLWTGLAAAGLWATNYWPQSINRLGFRANTLPLIVTLAVIAWLHWTACPSRRRAVVFGVLAGLTLYTYLAGRITLLLWPLLFLTLSGSMRRALRPTLSWAVLAFVLVVTPLAVHFALHPHDAAQRVSFFAIVQPGTPIGEILALLVQSCAQVMGGFLGWAGDPNPRHNLPGRPPFSPVVAAFFVLGVLVALAGLRYRSQRSWTVLLWWDVLSLPAILALEDNPHFLRLFGALPAALLLAGSAIGHAMARVLPATGKKPLIEAGVGLLLGTLLAVEGVQTAQAYFHTWARQTDLYEPFQGDMWTLGERISAVPGAIGVVPLNPHYGPQYREYGLEYAFRDATILQLQVYEDEIAAWLDGHLGQAGGKTILMPVWSEGPHVDADPKNVVSFYLAREGTWLSREEWRGFDLLAFRLGPEPQFLAGGRRVPLHVPFDQGLTLVEAEWGPAYPNPQRADEQVIAGTPVWAILTWSLEHPVPDVKVTLDIVDEQGRRLGSDERLLMDEGHLTTSRWPAGQVARSYHLVTVPAAYPPGPIRLESRAYDAHTLAPILPQTPTANLATLIAIVP